MPDVSSLDREYFPHCEVRSDELGDDFLSTAVSLKSFTSLPRMNKHEGLVFRGLKGCTEVEQAF